jgi:hypothetical protein
MIFINTELLTFTDENSVDLDSENRVPYLHANLAERTFRSCQKYQYHFRLVSNF